jgi:hypothetical protein
MSSTIDETPLSAFPYERRNSLEKHLQTRPEMQDLKNRHILLNTNVAPYMTMSFIIQSQVSILLTPSLPQISPVRPARTGPPARYRQSEEEPGEET